MVESRSSNSLQDGYRKLFNCLRKEKITTWFELGLFLDRIKDNRKKNLVTNRFDIFKKQIRGGIAFVTFDYGIDGVSIEIAKYASAFERLLSEGDSFLSGKKKKRPNIYWVGGHFSKETETILDPNWERVVLRNIRGFPEWDGYREYFFTHLDRGSEQYNRLAKKIWAQVVEISLDLAQLILDKKIKLLFCVNVMSNPGNVSLSYALSIICEFMDVYILGNHHDFYWEEGRARLGNLAKSGLPVGARDHFFKNAHIGEVFSLIEFLYPWESRKSFHTVINVKQREHLIKKFGFNPISVANITTYVDLKKYKPCNDNEKIDILKRLHLVFSGGKEKLTSTNVHTLPSDCSHIGLEGKSLLLGHEDGVEINLKRANLLFIQPTRIIRRKKIEICFKFISKLLENISFKEFFKQNPQLTITLLVTGPLASDQGEYLNMVIKNFQEFLTTLTADNRLRIFLSFPFGLENKDILKEKKLNDLTISEIYSVASVVLLPSETEGRGLPIIESCAAGVPIICNRYNPEHVYAEVIGENLDKSKRLNVFEFRDEFFSDELLDKIAETFIKPQVFKKLGQINRDVVKLRYCQPILVKSLERALAHLWQRSSEDLSLLKIVKDAFKLNKKRTQYNEDFHRLVLAKNRSYIPGLTQLEFMIYLKSLIDPSFFRVEEMELRGRVMLFASYLIRVYCKNRQKFNDEYRIRFFKAVDYIFEYYKGSDLLAIDHSLSYRHRHRRHYPYRKVTEYELYGVVAIIFREIVGSSFIPKFSTQSIGYFKDFKSSLVELLGGKSEDIKINDSKHLIDDLQKQLPIAYFPGHFIKNEMKIFVINTMKNRLGLSVDHELTKDDLVEDEIRDVAGITLFAREEPISNVTYDSVLSWMKKDGDDEIKLLFEVGLLRVMKTKMVSFGVHLGQLGKEATTEMLKIKEKRGFCLVFDESAFSIDMIDMPSYRLGKIKYEMNANFMGLKIGDFFLQWVPAGVKPNLSYPTPIQKNIEFAKVIKSELFLRAVRKLGEEEVYQQLRVDADQFGSPIKKVLEGMLNEKKRTLDNLVQSTVINGLHADGLPWSGAKVEVALPPNRWKFITAFTGKKATTVGTLIDNYEKSYNTSVSFAWNGGYILNPELVGKLGLPEDYIGSPLGLVCVEGKILSLPLYNKAAFIVEEDGVKLKRANLKNGLTIVLASGEKLSFKANQRNKIKLPGEAIYYDLLYNQDYIPAKDRVLYRFVGNRVIEKIEDRHEEIKILPVGLVISLPKNRSISLSVGTEVNFEISGLEKMVNAIEAGPMLITSGKIDIDMEKEGWKTANSINTQAARLDYTDMRGPKIGVGIAKNGALIIIAINGRIRESVGATHTDLANILKKFGAAHAMGFDPGGSVTLIVDNQQLNISPYNKNYEDNIYCCSPMPRTVGNAILGVKI